MSPRTRNPKKERIRDVQELYTQYFIIASIICVFLLGLLIASFSSIIQANVGFGIIITLLILVPSLPFTLYIRFNNQNHRLKTPPFLPEETLKIIRNTAIIFFVLVFAYGILVYPYGPIKPDANIFTDKTGKAHSYDEFMIFQKWEFTFIISWCIFGLQTLMFLPLSDGRTRKWWKF